MHLHKRVSDERLAVRLGGEDNKMFFISEPSPEPTEQLTGAEITAMWEKIRDNQREWEENVLGLACDAIAKAIDVVWAMPDEPETREQYMQRREELAKKRVSDDLTAEALKKINKDKADLDKHWTDKLKKPWPGAIGSLWELKI